MRLLHLDFSILGTSAEAGKLVKFWGEMLKAKTFCHKFSFGNLGRSSFAAIPPPTST